MVGLVPKRFTFGVAIWAFIMSFTLNYTILYMIPTILTAPLLSIIAMAGVFYIVALTWYLMHRVDTYNPYNAWKAYVLLIIFYGVMALIIYLAFRI
ncbi:MAG: hypothetical protein ACO2ON_01645 [Candidatus Nanopusillus sp.]